MSDIIKRKLIDYSNIMKKKSIEHFKREKMKSEVNLEKLGHCRNKGTTHSMTKKDFILTKEHAVFFILSTYFKSGSVLNN